MDDIKIDDKTIKDSTENKDRVEEYFELKETIKTLRGDLKDLKEQHLDWEEFQEVSQKVKELRDNLKHDENIQLVTEKIATLKERMEMIKEIIKAEMIELEQIEVKKDGRKLKIVQVLKEMKDEDEN